MSHWMIDLLFSLSLLCLLFTYFIYPMSLRVLGRILRQENTSYHSQNTSEQNLPQVTFIVAAYNEEDVLDDKIKNFNVLDYPKEKIEILIGSDGSRDRTNEILKQAPSYITAVINEQNQGKAAVLNQLVALAKGDILIFCDANTMLERNTVRKLVSHFQNPQVGCASGRLILRDSGDYSLSEGESIYWTMESEIKRLESRLGVLMGVNGALYSIRKELFREIPVKKPVMDDFWVCIEILLQNYQVVYETAALGVETTSAVALGEFKRKIRIGQANFNYLWRFLALLRPWQPLQALAFLGHKLTRWFAPHFLIILLVTSFLQGSLWLTAFGYLQVVFYLMALWAHLTQDSKNQLPFSKTAYYFSIMNLALLIGFFQSFKTQRGGGWERIARNASDT